MANIERPSWDEYFLGIAEKVSEMGTCGRKKAGAVLVNTDTKEIISTGFNGAPKGLEHCTNMHKHLCDGGCLNDENRCVKAIHAEHNAILFAKQDLSGAVMYCTDEPCENCTKYMVQTGIKKVVFKKEYANKYNSFFNKGMEWVHYRQPAEQKRKWVYNMYIWMNTQEFFCPSGYYVIEHDAPIDAGDLLLWKTIGEPPLDPEAVHHKVFAMVVDKVETEYKRSTEMRIGVGNIDASFKMFDSMREADIKRVKLLQRTEKETNDESVN